MTWYAVCSRSATNLDGNIWTVSQKEDECGWETDSGCDGYGLSKSDATRLARAANLLDKIDDIYSSYPDREAS